MKLFKTLIMTVIMLLTPVCGLPAEEDLPFPRPAQIYEHVLRTDIVRYAENFLGVPYVWGASGPNSFDCSGFTSYVLRHFEIDVFRTSGAQRTQGERVNVEQALPGDLIFFSSARSGKNRVGHVGIVTENSGGDITFIHASSRKGVIRSRLSGPYSRRFIGINKVIC